METEIQGGCLCGGTRYRLEALPVSLADCHCLDCRRASGAPFVTWGVVPRLAIRVTEGERRVVEHAGRWRSFAACCGTPLFFGDALDAPMVEVTICTLDDPAPFGPQRVIWTEDRLPWVVTEEGLPHFVRSRDEG